jgi:hypothetical protein
LAHLLHDVYEESEERREYDEWWDQHSSAWNAQSSTSWTRMRTRGDQKIGCPSWTDDRSPHFVAQTIATCTRRFLGAAWCGLVLLVLCVFLDNVVFSFAGCLALVLVVATSSQCHSLESLVACFVAMGRHGGTDPRFAGNRVQVWKPELRC